MTNVAMIMSSSKASPHQVDFGKDSVTPEAMEPAKAITHARNATESVESRNGSVVTLEMEKRAEDLGCDFAIVLERVSLFRFVVCGVDCIGSCGWCVEDGLFWWCSAGEKSRILIRVRCALNKIS